MFNFFIKQLEDFENVFRDISKAEIINQIENSIISENPYSTLEIQDNDLITYTCICPIVDYRWITSSTGHAQQRFIISTTLKIGEFSSVIEISLANRDEMGFRMLIGRTALKEGILINPKHSFLMSPKTMLTKK